MGALAMGGFAVACSVSAGVTHGAVVPRLPEPAGDDGTPGWTKPPYASLATPAGIATAGAAGLVCGAVASVALSPRLWPLALVLAGPTASLALVDARTTYLPFRLTRGCQLLALAAACGCLVLSPAAPTLALRLLGATLLTGLLFWVLWRISGALGFGDVRLAPLLAALAAAVSWTCWTDFLLLGTASAALWGLVTQAFRRRRPSPLGSVFPYGPGLFLGCWLAVLMA